MQLKYCMLVNSQTAQNCHINIFIDTFTTTTRHYLLKQSITNM